MDDRQEALNDVESLDLKKGKWTTIYQNTDDVIGHAEKSISSLNRAKACMVVHSQRQSQEISSVNDVPSVVWKKAEDLLKFEGLYVFGGLFKDGSTNDKLHILTLQNDYDNHNRMKFVWKSDEILDI